MLKHLKSIGLKSHPLEECVLYGEVNGSNMLLIIYVDDILVCGQDQNGINKIKKHLEKQYGPVTGEPAQVFSYLGMEIDFSHKSHVTIGMSGFIHDWLNSEDIPGTAATPALQDLFSIDPESPRLSEKDSKSFHSSVAKALYLGKRVRPDIMTTVSFLTTRVQDSTEEDMLKLRRLIRYLNRTIHEKLTISMSTKLQLSAYIDASFAVHHNMKSHSGVVLTLGQGFFYVKSTKQKMVSKSSTEAELIAVSDHLGIVLWAKDFIYYLCNIFNVNGMKTKLLQDNKSTIKLILNGKPKSENSRHISIRYFFIHEKVTDGEICLEYVPTEVMVADAQTKPLQGKRLKYLSNLLLGIFMCPLYEP